MQEVSWNPWHGCKKLSPGCMNCYVYRTDARHERDASVIQKTADYDLPIRLLRGGKRKGEYKIASGSTVYTCFTSDFLLAEADAWRPEAWRMMRQRQDLRFLFITKRIDRLYSALPADWGAGYDNVAIGCTCENQAMADHRLPIFLNAPIKHRFIICEPLLEAIDLSAFDIALAEKLIAGGESGQNARNCNYAWVLALRQQCIAAGIGFWFKQTGARFIKDGLRYNIPRAKQHLQAKKAAINYEPPTKEQL